MIYLIIGIIFFIILLSAEFLRRAWRAVKIDAMFLTEANFKKKYPNIYDWKKKKITLLDAKNNKIILREKE